jgi:hypothetical protein
MFNKFEEGLKAVVDEFAQMHDTSATISWDKEYERFLVRFARRFDAEASRNTLYYSIRNRFACGVYWQDYPLVHISPFKDGM